MYRYSVQIAQELNPDPCPLTLNLKPVNPNPDTPQPLTP